MWPWAIYTLKCVAPQPFARTTSHSCQFTSKTSRRSYWPEKTGTCHFICNPATREHASLGQPWDFKTLGMYRHRPTGEYRVLLQRRGCRDSPKEQIGCYLLALGSYQPPRYIGCPDTALLCFKNPVQNYESEVWDFKYKIQLPVTEIWRKFEPCVGNWYWNVDIVSGDGDVLLLVRFGWHLLHVDSDGKLINSFNPLFGDVYVSRCRLKQSLVKHTFSPSLEGYVVNALPFV
uniref:Uncharacterized protein n=1 Tax=Aegilops tauschii TaxID=37682 RepID=R7W861_AEGTA